MRGPGHVHDPPTGPPLWSTRRGQTTPPSRHTPHILQWGSHPPARPQSALEALARMMVVFCPHSPVFRLVLLQLSPEPAHSPDCLLRCSNSPPFRPASRSKLPPSCISTTVVNPCTRVQHYILTGRWSRTASGEHLATPDGCLFRCGRDVTGVVCSSTSHLGTVAGTGPFTVTLVFPPGGYVSASPAQEWEPGAFRTSPPYTVMAQ